jgi:NADPH:quinone reductase-like Zn-dependent oxidoreductase
MLAAVLIGEGPPERLMVQEVAAPTPGHGEVLIDVRAAGVNFVDLMIRLGLYPDAPRLPAIIGFEVPGVVAAIGQGVTEFAPSDRVAAGVRFGGYAQRTAAQADNVLGIGDEMSYATAAAR